MKFYINLNDYEVLELEGELIERKLEYDRVEDVRIHIENGLHSTKKINTKGYLEAWKVIKINGIEETLLCKARYEEDEFDSRICDKIMEMVIVGEDISEYGKEIDKSFIGLLSTQEVAEKFNISESTIRRAVMEKRLKEGVDCRKFGKSWAVKEKAAERLWGNKNND